MSTSPLESLIENGQTEDIIALLSQTPELAVKETSHHTSPLMLACYYKKTDIALVIAEFMPNLSLFDACAIGKFDDVTLLVFKNPELINAYSVDGFTPLGLACYFDHEEIAKFLLLKGAEVNLASKNGYHVFPLHSAVNNNNYGLATALLNAGAYPNVCQKLGIAPLHFAAQHGNIEMIIALLEKGAEVTLRTDDGKLPADLAAEKGFKEIAEILRDDD
ncbi:ankyrin repeat domain-containing protein [Pedobacter sp.]|uniref:ankyrin repeat domain-containing protein n=1 Tax=Pedobacter sp. TaxID=1411316 RepID=UPI00396CDD56